MLKSMTGYGTVQKQFGGLSLQIELKTLNSKFLDLNFRIPKELAEEESKIRRTISDRLIRGKILLTIDLIQEADPQPSVTYNEVLFQKYYSSLKALASKVGEDQINLFNTALESPGVMIPKPQQSMTKEAVEVVHASMGEVLDQCDGFRQKEGARLEEELASYGEVIKNNLDEVVALDKTRIERITTRIKTNLGKVVDEEGLDKNRLEQELIYYIEKLDITEEKVRLYSHLDFFRLTLKSGENTGKKLGFISQEMGREINTIGSKANDAEIQKHVVAMKEELEKIKEQVLNII